MLTKDKAKELAVAQPWLYHVVVKPDEESRTTVKSDGLAPGVSRRNWHPLFKPRRGHVYLATREYLGKWWMRPDVWASDLYAVDTRSLVPALVNPDEDQFCHDQAEACERFGIEAHRGTASYGEWADAVELGHIQRHVIWSLAKGSVAYNGIIPPTALLRWTGTNWTRTNWADTSRPFEHAVV